MCPKCKAQREQQGTPSTLGTTAEWEAHCATFGTPHAVNDCPALTPLRLGPGDIVRFTDSERISGLFFTSSCGRKEGTSMLNGGKALASAEDQKNRFIISGGEHGCDFNSDTVNSNDFDVGIYQLARLRDLRCGLLRVSLMSQKWPPAIRAHPSPLFLEDGAGRRRASPPARTCSWLPIACKT